VRLDAVDGQPTLKAAKIRAHAPAPPRSAFEMAAPSTKNVPLNPSEATRELLELLFELWPDCPLKLLVGDKAWDFSDLAEMCLVNYGVHLVAVQSKTQKNQERVLTNDQHKNLAGYRGDGTVLCRHHGTEMTFKGSEFGKRDGLKPGEASKLSEFRMRFTCEQCGKSYSISPKGFGATAAIGTSSPTTRATRSDSPSATRSGARTRLGATALR
jgi:hypothetical protein